MLPKNIYDISKMFIFRIMLKPGFNHNYNSPILSDKSYTKIIR